METIRLGKQISPKILLGLGLIASHTDKDTRHTTLPLRHGIIQIIGRMMGRMPPVRVPLAYQTTVKQC